MLANVDRLIVGENAGLECKTASAYSADKWKDGHIPESYEIQCHHYMAVTGADAWYIACVILGRIYARNRFRNSKGTMLLLRTQLIEYHAKYMELGDIPSYAYQNFCEMYDAYHALGGNGMVTKMKQEIEELHIKRKGE